MAVRIEKQAEPIPGYRLIDRLGGGGFGEVWRAEAPGGLHKAIKFVYGDLQEVGEEGMRAEQELKALSRVKTVRHPYILSLERFDVIDGQLIIVMELADKNLWDRYKECRAQGLPGIGREELLGYLEETAEALDLMNSQYQLQHLDIKPQNLFLVHQHIKVADFGLVKDLEGMQASVTGGVTPVYAAPETFDGWVSRYCDQYSLAIVYQELLTAQRPFVGNSVRQLVMQHLQGTPDLSSLPPADRAIIARALAKNPEERHASCKDLVRALRHGAPSVILPPPLATVGDAQRTEAPATPVMPGLEAPEEQSGRDTDDDAAENPTQWIRSRGEGLQRAQSTPSGPTPPPEAEGPGCLFPALVVGVGRLGLLVLQQLRASLQRRFGSIETLPQLRLLYLDTDSEALRPLGPGQGGDALAPQDVLIAPLNRPGHYLKARDGRISLDSWLDPQMLYRIPRNRVTLGVRALGRLAFCDHYRSISRRLRSRLEECLDPDALAAAALHTGLALRSNRPRAYVVCGLGGGTGGGMFLDLAYLLRRQLKQFGYPQPDVVGLFLAPTVSPVEEVVPPADGDRKAADRRAPAPGRSSAHTLTAGNTFAALTELSYFATPGNTFKARYQEQESALQDPEPPFTRCLLLPLPADGGEVAAQHQAALAGEFLGRDLCSSLGPAAALARAGLSAPPWPERGLFCQTFGLYQLISPSRPMTELAARGLCARLLQRWMSKDAAPLRAAVEARIREQWSGSQWDAGPVADHLHEVARATLGQEPEATFAALLAPLVPPAPEPRNRTPPPLPEPAKVRRTLHAIEDVVGPPPGEEVMGEAAQLPELLREAAREMIAERGQDVAEVVVGFIEQPQYRLAGAEEAVRRIVTLIEEVLGEHEPKFKAAATLAAETHKRIQAVTAALHKAAAGKGRAPVSAADVVELLRQYARARYEALVLQQVIAVFVSLRGQLTDQLREVNFCRVRLGELLHSFAGAGGLLAGPKDAKSSARRAAAASRATPLRVKRLASGEGDADDGMKTGPLPAQESRSGVGVGQCLFPGGCRTMNEVIEQYLASVTPEALLELDDKVQGVIRQQFTALVQVCLTSANVLDDLELAMRQQAEAFVARHAPWAAADSSVAELFLTQHPDPEEAHGAIHTAFDEAAPRLCSGPMVLSAPPEVAIIMVPADPAGERFEALAREALADAEPAPATSPDDIVLYRELPYLRLADLDQLGPDAQDAYQQMLAVDHFTPHTRTDVPFTPAVAQRASAIG
jgi:hypothetical protein